MKIDNREIGEGRLRELLDYDPITGFFSWKVRRQGVRFGRRKIGAVQKNGYRTICIDYRTYLAHRLAWLYVTGDWPKQIDHKDLNKDNNAFSNLREATGSQNHQNKRRMKNNRSGFKGVCRTSDGYSWRAAIKIDGEIIHLGSFKDPETAHRAYKAAAMKAFGVFARTE